METKTLKIKTLEAIEKEKKKLDNKTDLKEILKINKIIALVKKSKNKNWNIEFLKNGIKWEPKNKYFKTINFLVLDNEAFIFIWCADEKVDIVKIGEVK